MSDFDYVHHFRSTPTETLRQRLTDKRLHPKAAAAYRQVLAEREAYVPLDLPGRVSISGHSGVYYAYLEGSKRTMPWGLQDGFIIPDELVDKHGLSDDQEIVFHLEPDLSVVSKIVSVK